MITDYAEMLRARGVRPSQQRVAIYGELVSKRHHPSVDDVFEKLRRRLPTLSRTTVYATMRAFCEKGLAREVRTDGGELRYDGFTAFHAHFKCRACGAVCDIPVAGRRRSPYASIPAGYVVDDEQLVYYGLCPNCSTKKGKKK